MSRVRFKRIFICAPKSKRKIILETLQRTGLVEITSGSIDDGDLKKEDVSSTWASLTNSASMMDQALAILDTYVPEEKGLLDSLGGTTRIDKESYYAKVEHIRETVDRAIEILDTEQKISEAKASETGLRTSLEGLQIWRNLDIPPSLDATSKTRIFTGSVAEELDADGLYNKLSDHISSQTGSRSQSGEDRAQVQVLENNEVPPMAITVLYNSRTVTAFCVITYKDDAAPVENALRSIGYTMAPRIDRIPAEEIESLQDEISGYEKTIAELSASFEGFRAVRDDLKFASDYFHMRADKYELIGSIPESKNVFFIDGFTPARTATLLKEKLEELGGAVQVSDPADDDEVPVELKNDFLAEPVETVVESYSYPGPGEIDPSPVVACFYYILFGMMLSDAGYGILLALGCGFVLLKVKDLRPGLKKMMKLMFYSGITTTFWGFMFGSFFGDAVGVIATTFFNRPDITLEPILFNPQEEPMRLLVLAFAIGIVHLFTGLGVKFYELIRDGHIYDAICDVVFWYMFIGGAIVFMLSMEMFTSMFSIGFTLGPAVSDVAGWVAIIGAIGVVLTGGRDNKNWGVRLASGLYSAYGCTSWLSDILSYSRLLALGLATGVIAQVFNKMGQMVAGALPLPIGVVIFALIFCVGHVLNMAINLMGAYVHTNRLQYVEFFGKFYNGGGKPFTPFKEKSKYYTVEEEI